MKFSTLLRNMLKVFLGDIFSKLISFGTALLIIRGLSTLEYAAYTVFNSISSLFPSLLGTGINRSLVSFSAEYISKTGKKPYEIYLVNFLCQILFYLIISIPLFLYSKKVVFFLFGNEDYFWFFRYGLIAGFGILIMEAGRYVYQAEERFGNFILVLWLKQALIFVGIFSLFTKKKLFVLNAVKFIIIINLIVGIVLVLHILKESDFKSWVLGFTDAEKKIIRKFLTNSIWLIAYYVILAAFQRLDIFMLSHYTTRNELAQYGVAYKYYTLGLLFINSIRAVLLPAFSKINMQDPLTHRSFITKWLRSISWIGVPILIFVLLGKPLFIWVNGIKYARAFDILCIFAFGIWLSWMFSPSVNLLIGKKAFKFLFMLGVTAFIMNFWGNYFIIPVWGGVGAAVTTVFTHGFINLVSTYKLLEGR